MADVYEKDLAQKTSLTTSDYIRVVGSDNVSYKQPINSVGDITKKRVFLMSSGNITASTIDSYTTDGIYQGFMSLGAPFSPASWGTLTVVHANSLVIEQIISTRYYMAQRHYEGGSWTEWTLFPTRAEVDALNRKLLKFINASSIQITLSNTPSSSHFGNAVLFNANQGTVAMFNLGTSPTATVVSGSLTYTVSLSGNTFTITPNTTLWGLTQVYFDEN